MTAIAADLKQAMPFTTRYPELGTGPIDVAPLIDPGLFELEREKIFKKTWLYVGRAEEIPEPGDYKVRQLDVVSTSVIIVRDQTGKLNAFHNLCSHRGNKLIQEEGAQTFGSTGNHLMTCRFHAWSYSTDGKLHGIARQLFSSISSSVRMVVSSHNHQNAWAVFKSSATSIMGETGKCSDQRMRS